MPESAPLPPRGKRAELARWIERERPAQIGEREWQTLRAALAPVSAGYLRRLLRASGVKLAPLVQGVRQESMSALEESLLALLGEYERGDMERRAAIRGLVIEAKNHARWAGRRNAGLRAVKEEMLLWLLTWLENPPLFPAWAELRKNYGRSQT